jgi:predicted permease
VIGKVIRVNDAAITIVGVIERGFTGTQRPYGPTPDITLPLVLDTLLTAGNQNTSADAPPRLTQATYWWLQIMGRRKPGITPQQVESNFEGVFQQSARQSIDALAARVSPEVQTRLNLQNRQQIPRLRVTSGARGIYDAEGEVQLISMILGAVVTLILLIVCANVANLMLSRATARGREIAVRISIGATRWRVVRQLLTESVLLACIGGALGLLVAVWAKDFMPQGIQAPLDWHVLLFALLLSCMTGILFGLLPAFRATALAGAALKENSRTLAGSRSMLGKSLLVVQIALSFVLLVGAGLFLRTLSNLRSVDVAFDSENLVLFDVNPRLNRYDPDRIARLYDEIAERLRGLGGVRAVTISDNGLMSGNYFGTNIVIQDRATENRGDLDLLRIRIDPSFFETMRIPMVLGRSFTPRDDARAPRVAIINEAAALKFFPNENPIGRRFGHDRDNTNEIEIVGVARDTKYNRIKEPAPPLLYEPLSQGEPQSVTFAVRTEGDPVAMMPLIRDAVRQIDANIAVLDMTTQEREIEEKFGQERLLAQAYSAFGGIALLLASIGLFGLMSYNVARRTNEIGVRLALGAQRADVLRMVMRESILVVGIGLIIGLAAAIAAARLVRNVLFGLSPTDPVSIAVAVFVLAGVSLLAAYLPARRASRVEPVSALRYE